MSEKKIIMSHVILADYQVSRTHMIHLPNGLILNIQVKSDLDQIFIAYEDSTFELKEIEKQVVQPVPGSTLNRDELLVAISTLAQDLRGDWSCNYNSRIETLQILLSSLERVCPERGPEIREMESVCIDQLDADYGIDGRYFRGCYLYMDGPDSGKTDECREFLLDVLNYPEYTWVKEEE